MRYWGSSRIAASVRSRRRSVRIRSIAAARPGSGAGRGRSRARRPARERSSAARAAVWRAIAASRARSASRRAQAWRAPARRRARHREAPRRASRGAGRPAIAHLARPAKLGDEILRRAALELRPQALVERRRAALAPLGLAPELLDVDPALGPLRGDLRALDRLAGDGVELGAVARPGERGVCLLPGEPVGEDAEGAIDGHPLGAVAGDRVAELDRRGAAGRGAVEVVGPKRHHALPLGRMAKSQFAPPRIDRLDRPALAVVDGICAAAVDAGHHPVADPDPALPHLDRLPAELAVLLAQRLSELIQALRSRPRSADHDRVLPRPRCAVAVLGHRPLEIGDPVAERQPLALGVGGDRRRAAARANRLDELALDRIVEATHLLELDRVEPVGERPKRPRVLDRRQLLGIADQDELCLVARAELLQSGDAFVGATAASSRTTTPPRGTP